MPPKRVASEAAKATQGRACFEGRCGSAFLASCGRASPVSLLESGAIEVVLVVSRCGHYENPIGEASVRGVVREHL